MFSVPQPHGEGPVEATEDDFEKRNVFKDQWEDSDAIFIVEEKQFHVHRQVLSLLSPAFKAMFTSEFREKYQKEIPLPDKKASVFLTFLMVIYPQNRNEEITMENVGGLLALGDEYQVAKVTMECRKFLMSTALNNQLAMQVLVLTQKFGLDDVRERCCNHLKSVVETDELEKLDGFQDLDAKSLKGILLPQLKECRSCLEDVLPQMVGLMEFAVYLMQTKDTPSIDCCQDYRRLDGTPYSSSMYRLRNCTTCCDMFKGLSDKGKYPLNRRSRMRYKYGNDLHFDENVVDVACKVMDLLDY